MNMNNRPTIKQLRELIAAADDEADHHILWVDNHGEVSLTRLEGQVPAHWAASNESIVRFRYETLARGNSYVGPAAALKNTYIRELLADLVRDWRSGATGFLGR
jgi:hypothetical protein